MMRCDFCLYPDLQESDAATHKARVQIFSPEFVDGDCLWAACPDCDALIKAGNWDAVIDRSLIGDRAINGPSNEQRTRLVLETAYALLFGATFERRPECEGKSTSTPSM